MRPASHRPRSRPLLPRDRGPDPLAYAPAAHEVTTATQHDAVEHDAVESEPPAELAAGLGSGNLVRNTLIVAVAFIASRILGFAREILIARQFGTGGEADAYAAAFRLPDLLFLVVMSASFGSAFIPVFAGYLTRGDPRRAWELANAVLTWAIALTVVTGALIFVLADPIIRYLIAPSLDDEFIRLSASLMRVLVLSPLLLGLGIAAKGILEAQDRFLMPALAPLVYNAGIIVGIVVLAPTAGIEGVAVGVIIGAAAHALIQLPAVLRSGLSFRPTFDRSVEGLDEVGRLLVPRVIGQVAFAANFIVVTNFASTLGEGGPASINYAWQLLMLPHGILALSISTVIFPAMARQWELADVAGLNRTFSQAIRPLIFLSVPISIVLFLYREPIVAALLQRGDFDRASTVAVAAPLAALAAALIAYGLVEVLTRAFYAMKDARTPVVTGLFIIVVNIATVAVTIDALDGLALGLALAVSTSVEAVILLVVMTTRLRALGIVPDRTWGPWLLRVAVATAVALAFGLAATRGLDRVWALDAASYPVRLGLLAIAVGLVFIGYALVGWALSIPELGTIERRVAGLFRPATARLPTHITRQFGVSRGLPLRRGAVASGPGPDGEFQDDRDDRDDRFDSGDLDDGGEWFDETEPADERRRPVGRGRDWLDRAPFDRPERFGDPPDHHRDDRDDRDDPDAGFRPRLDRRPPPDSGDDPADGRRTTGRFGGGRRPPVPSLGAQRTGPGSYGQRPPFRSAQQPTMPSWYTPSRRDRRPPQSTDYTEDPSGRRDRPRSER